MKWSSGHLLKWLEPSKIREDFEWVFARHCAVVCKGNDEKIIGFVVFEPRNLDASFWSRLESRFSKPECAQSKIELITPNFLRQKAMGFLKNSKIPLNHVLSDFIKISQKSSVCQVRSKLKIINVDDSPVILKLLKNISDSFGFVETLGQITDPLKAVDEILSSKPDVVTMDIQMPKMTGHELVSKLLDKTYIPVVMVSSVSLEEGSLVFDALNEGAFDYIQKPKLEDRKEFSEQLLEKLLAAVEGKKPRSALNQIQSKKTRDQFESSANFYPPNLIWCLGASTGGTQALTQVFTSLPTRIPPTLVVLHIPPVFSKAFANTVNELCPFTIKEAEEGEEIKADHIYIAAGGLQMGVKQVGDRCYLQLLDLPPVNRFKPSVDFMMKNVAELKGKQFVAGILTGMGKDGAEGLLSLKKKGAFTFAQDEETSIVYGMPRAAKENGAADQIVALDLVAESMLKLSQKLAKAA